MNQREENNDSSIEHKILGNILIDSTKISPFMAFIRPEDFFRKEHQTIYETMLSLTKQGQIFDFITVTEILEKQNKLEAIGGSEYIRSLITQLRPSENTFPSEALYPGPIIEELVKLREVNNKETRETVLIYNEEDLTHLETRQKIARFSPSFSMLEKLLEEQGRFLDKLHWRNFEELVADLLQKDGYQVQLGPGTKDDGIDIITTKEDEIHGWIMSVWQAKKLKPGNKVEISTIRELADTRQKHNASKGIIVTSTYLTHGALARVTEDEFLLRKIDRDDLLQWIQRIKRKYR